MSCDVYISQCLLEDDCPNEDVEQLVHSSMRIVRDLRPTGRGRSGRRLRPREIFELQVESNRGDDLMLKAYKERRQMIAELHYRSTKIRALHTHEGHRNPRCPRPLPNGHMHFPTNNYPLGGGPSSYAYEIPCSDEENLVFFIGLFCAELDIELGAFQMTLDSATRR